MLPASCSISTSMRDTSALRWTESLSFEAAQKHMHTEKSNHYSKDNTDNPFI